MTTTGRYSDGEESPMVFLIGHRGSGKSTLARLLKASVYDLDDEIEKRTGRSIGEIFAASPAKDLDFISGEEEFRKLERETLQQLLNETNRKGVVVLGAGFEGDTPSAAHVVWLRRPTDFAGRSFLNRPRLDVQTSPWLESRDRHLERDPRYRKLYHEELMLPEGFADESTPLEFRHTLLEFFEDRQSWKTPYDLTLLPENFRQWERFWAKRKNWGIRWLEVRDDRLTPEQIRLVSDALAADSSDSRHSPSGTRILFSRRKLQDSPIPNGATLDWALELGPPPRDADILSLHKRHDYIEDSIAALEKHPACIYKLAIEIRDFRELEIGHRWWQQNPNTRAFLPCSPNGRWQWYRSLFGPRMPIHFFREGDGSSWDQPYIWQTLLQPALQSQFAAVLGAPVTHSRSPLEHWQFFKNKQMPFVAIEIHAREWEQALPVLRLLGLKFAAVTSPLKLKAYQTAQEHSPEAQLTESANTLVLADQIQAHNTDVVALVQLRAQLPEFRKPCLWGGGGIKASVRRAWPDVHEVSAREGTLSSSVTPDLVIWAAPRSPEVSLPPPNIRPRLILDLNYSEDSMGLEWAVQQNLPYQSGLAMFKLQAEAQRQYWLEFFK